MENANLPRPFLIEFNGQFVVNPRSNTDMEFDGRVPASVGDRQDAAVFRLEDGILRKADENNGPMMFFGRFVIEPLAYMPMPVYWFPQRGQVQPTTFTGDEGSPQVFNCRGILGRYCMVTIFQSDYE
jgi:hypothetical protein